MTSTTDSLRRYGCTEIRPDGGRVVGDEVAMGTQTSPDDDVGEVKYEEEYSGGIDLESSKSTTFCSAYRYVRI